jgi:hypothetical protein
VLPAEQPDLSRWQHLQLVHRNCTSVGDVMIPTLRLCMLHGSTFAFISSGVWAAADGHYLQMCAMIVVECAACLIVVCHPKSYV